MTVDANPVGSLWQARRLYELRATLQKLQGDGARVYGLAGELEKVEQAIADAERHEALGDEAVETSRRRVAAEQYRKAAAIIADNAGLTDKLKRVEDELEQARQLREKAAARFQEGDWQDARSRASEALAMDGDSNSARRLYDDADAEWRAQRKATRSKVFGIIAAVVITLGTIIGVLWVITTQW